MRGFKHHFTQAEEQRELAESADLAVPYRELFLRSAQVHATLALAAATYGLATQRDVEQVRG